jgi:hypothetical protein
MCWRLDGWTTPRDSGQEDLMSTTSRFHHGESVEPGPDEYQGAHGRSRGGRAPFALPSLLLLSSPARPLRHRAARADVVARVALTGSGGVIAVRAAIAALALAAALGAAPAAAWEVDTAATPAQLDAFHRRFSFVAYPFPGHGATPLGITGFRVDVGALADRDLDDDPEAGPVIDGSVPGGWVTVGRVSARKGLPAKIDLGASYARALDGDGELASVDLQWALLDGGAVSPALAFRLVGQRSLDDGPYELEQYGAEVLLSKGFAVLTPYVGAGVLYSDGTFDLAGGGSHGSDFNSGFVYAGVTLNLLLPKINVELQEGETLTGAVRIGFGF